MEHVLRPDKKFPQRSSLRNSRVPKNVNALRPRTTTVETIKRLKIDFQTKMLCREKIKRKNRIYTYLEYSYLHLSNIRFRGHMPSIDTFNVL